jgi:ABC-type glycerol-3-phosphate transport system substrate-binding protein
MTNMSSQRPTAPSSATRPGTTAAAHQPGDTNRLHHGDRHWDRNHHRWCGNNYYFYGGYPYYGSGYGYPFGYGYGYGYPSFGVSASFSNYSPYYGRRAYGSRGGSVTVQVQQRLAQAGYYRGAIDGVIGNGTRSAIRAYERAHGLRVDGRIDPDLLSRMGIS